MKTQTVIKSLLGALIAATAAAFLQADVVETKDGARLVGTVKKIAGGKITLGTSYAGDVSIAQSEVASLTMDDPLVIRLAGGTTMEGKITTSSTGQVAIAGGDGTINTSVDKIATTWAPGGTDPAVAALQRKWAYEAALDITGKSGNKSQFGSAVSMRATLKGSKDTLKFYTAYNRQETDDVKSADQFKAGIDYANNFRGRMSWYVRNEGGFDRIKDIELYNVSAAGLGYDMISKAHQTLTGRAGLSFRYEGYKNPLTEDVKSAGLDFGLNHTYAFETMKMTNSLSIVPSFDDFANYRAIHDSYFEMPLASSKWKLRLGLSNDYTSEPAPGVEKMDTTYYTRLVLNWD
ncbi:DUF481 domain-containing protein [Synoicihabitans lomoniglobus]|uniref:DUF481 domain-containing protein n=1 Tax=Synoicihabitans lomoniglobus TaxID=2909285 RepID=A0AAF0CMM5_9BACT|nr:DUF481 domain-containing protein [Opitutaceae bacterium LMO-M01]WED64353.1 DUF481 domain-containing protein [Opitutaceae bacterium LMO-M01]